MKATLAFPEAGRAAGNASCNRFTGSAEISGDTLKFGMLASTRMACGDEAVNSQETQYLKALAAAKRFELKDSTLRRGSLHQAAAFCAGTGHAVTLNRFHMPEPTVRSTIRFVAGRPNRFP